MEGQQQQHKKKRDREVGLDLNKDEGKKLEKRQCKEKNVNIIFFLPDRIQSARLKILHNVAKKKGFMIKNTFDSTITHVVSAYENMTQVGECFVKNGWKLHDDVEVINIDWFTESAKVGHFIEIRKEHRLIMADMRDDNNDPKDTDKKSSLSMAKFACQRRCPLDHKNKKLVDALLRLADFAALRNDPTENDYGRSLAFTRAASVFKTLSYEVTSVDEVKKLKDVGEHSRRVVDDILNHGFSSEVEELCGEWYQTLNKFTGIYGIGPATAKKWYEMGMKSLKDIVLNDSISLKDERICYGLAFYSELNSKMSANEAKHILDLIKRLLHGIDGQGNAELMGGFRRGKPSGHDCDILISHPTEGKEVGLVSKLVAELSQAGLVLQGTKQSNTYNPKLLSDSSSPRESNLDEFEKFLGILKCDKKYTSVVDVCSKEWRKEEKLCLEALESRVASGCELNKDRHQILKLLRESMDDDKSWVVRRVDLVVTPASQYPYAVVGWTGNKNFNRSIRLYAKKVLNIKLSSHGMYDLNKKCSIPAKSEKEVFDKLKLEYIEPEERNV